MLSDLFSGLPSLPANVKSFLVKVAPYYALVSIVLALPFILALFGFSAMAGKMMLASGAWMYAGGGILGAVLTLASAVCLALAVSGLFAHRASGWKLLYYSTLLNAIGSLIRFDIFGFLIGTGISLYVLFQIRSSYK